MKNNKNGITLIALVITIIVLLILAGISISLVSGENGVLTRADKASATYSMASAKEQANMRVAGCISEYMQKVYVDNDSTVGAMTTGEYVLSQINGEEDEDYQYSVSGSTITVTSKTTGEVLATGTIDDNGGIGWSDSVTSEASGNLETENGPKIGDTVKYLPNGTYIWDKTLAETGGSGTETLSSAPGQDCHIEKWKILRVYDENNVKKVDVVPTTHTKGLRFRGAQGYNNYVYLLNTACSNLYGNGSTITARNIKEEDFVRCGKQSQAGDSETKNDWTRARTSDWGNSNYGKLRNIVYNGQNKSYPVMYAYEQNSIITPEPNLSSSTASLSKTLTNSEQNSPITATQEGARSGLLTAGTSIQVYNSWYCIEYERLGEVLNEGVKDILVPEGVYPYWIATRSISSMTARVSFMVTVIGEYGPYAGLVMVYSDGEIENQKPYYSLFPVVTVPADSLLESQNSEFKWEVEQ